MEENEPLSITDLLVTGEGKKVLMELSPEEIEVSTGNVSVKAVVLNDGNENRKEVAQLYIGDPYSSIDKQYLQMKQYKEIEFLAGEKTEVQFELNELDFATYDARNQMWVTEEGYYDIFVGLASKDLTCKQRIYMDVVSQYSYGPNSDIKTIYEQDRIKVLLKDMFNKHGMDWNVIEENYKDHPTEVIAEIIYPLLEQIKEPQNKEEAYSDLDIFYDKIISIKRP